MSIVMLIKYLLHSIDYYYYCSLTDIYLEITHWPNVRINETSWLITQQWHEYKPLFIYQVEHHRFVLQFITHGVIKKLCTY